MVPSDITWFFRPDPLDSSGIGSGLSGSGLSGSGGVIDSDDTGDMGSEMTDIEFSEDRLSLTFSELQYSNEGIYTVMVQNLAGTSYAQIRLDVQGNVPHVCVMPRVGLV